MNLALKEKSNSPVYFFNPSYDVRNIDFFNLGIVSVASYLKSRGIPADVYMNYLDAELSDEKDYDRILKDILSRPHRFVGISCMTTQSIKALDLTRRIKEISPRTPVVWGGSHANVYAEYLMKKHEMIDFCIKGPGQRSCFGLYRFLSGEAIELSQIPGLVYRFNGGIKENKKAPLEQEIFDELIDYSVIVRFQPVERRFAGRDVKQVAIFNSVGCPYRCRFCINSVECTNIIFRKLNRVISEIKQVLDKGANSIFFIDELLVINPKRLDDFLNRIESEGLKFSWFGHARIDTVTSGRLNDERLKRIYELGCKELHFGIESGSPAMLERINKKIDVTQVIPVVEKVNNAGIIPKVNFIFGMPGETIEDVKKTIYLVMEIADRFKGRILIMNFFFYPIPGSPMTEESFMGLDLSEETKIKYCIDAAIYSVHPSKLFKHFDKEGFYGWISNKQFFAEVWFIARIISDICLPYKFGKAYNPQYKDWSINVSPQTYEELVDKCPEEADKDMVMRWLKKVEDFLDSFQVESSGSHPVSSKRE